MNKKIIGLFITLFMLTIVSLGFKGESNKDNSVRKTSINDQYRYIAINQILMWISNNGDGSHDPRTDGNGFYWPGGINATKSAIFEDGLIFGGKIGREIRVNGNTHRQGLQAGKILDNGSPDDPLLDKYRIYKIRKGWELLPPGPERDDFERDYLEWPVEDGAPWVDIDGDGIFTRGVDEPHFIGDEVLWYVANDMDPTRSTFTYGTLPMGLEFQTTVFGFKRTGALGDMVFKKYKIINKGTNLIRDMIVAYWSDTDLGDANDDYTGCDTALSLGYTWNSTNNDAIYGSPPPAVGYDFFQGPIVAAEPTDSAKFDGKWRHGYKNLPMTAFALYINTATYPWRDPQQGVPAGSIEFYNYMQGLVWDGSPFIDPHTGQQVIFVLTGDPETKTGWYEGTGWPGGPSAGDRRHVMSSGPFNMAPGDTQEVVVGIVIAVGTNNVNSVTALKRKDLAAQIAYDLDFQLTPPPPAPALHAVPADKQITLWWEPNAEDYNEGDPLIYNQNPPLDDTTYTFEGYRVWQYRDLSGSDPRLLQITDIENDITIIYDYETINGEEVLVPVIKGPNLGVRRFINITQDAYTNGPLFNGNPYYFGVTAYGYSKHSSPRYLENPPQIIEVFPGRPSIEHTYPYKWGDHIPMEQVTGNTDAAVILKVIDPNALTGHEYEVSFSGPDDTLKYNFVNLTTGDTLLKNSNRFIRILVDDVTKARYVPTEDTMGAPVFDGLMLLVQNLGKDSIAAVPGVTQRFKGVYETHGPGGNKLATPIDVLKNLNSTGKWKVKAKGSGASAGNLLWHAQLSFGYNDYELRFGDPSPYYLTGYAFSFTPPTRSDTLATNTVPFSAWDVGRLQGDQQSKLMIKTLDLDRSDSTRAIPDKTWSQLPNGDWEEIFTYQPATFSPDNPPQVSGNSQPSHHKFGNFAITGDLPETGTIIKVLSYKPITAGDVYRGKTLVPSIDNKTAAKENLDQISVFPNPYFGANSLERDKYQRFVRFTNLPNEVTVRIFSLSGVFIRRLEKSSTNQYLDWDLRNRDGLPVASGIYLAYLDMPGIGTKVMKIAVIMETQYIDRL